jgi:leucyl-tRNA synthetase
VLAHYGTGAIMAVPGHDERDHAFATAYGLPIVQVVRPADGSEVDVHASAFTTEGIGCNSGNGHVTLNEEPTAIAKKLMIEWLESSGIGKRSINFKLRDWLFSRQRYWGEPVPIMFFDDGSKRALSLDELPLVLPDVEDFKPSGTGESALATVDTWVNFVDAKTGKKARYETNTMPQWAGSCWYYLRFIDPHNDAKFCDSDKERYWMQGNGVDLYVGGTEHAVLHLLYARFWHKVLYDYGHVSTVEPFARLFHQGLILGEDGRKMSKSLGNVINPDDVVHDYGADALRLFEMFLGPLEDSKPWSTKGIEGVHRFLNRAWRLMMTEDRTLSPDVVDIPMTENQRRVLHQTIKKIGEDITNLSFNTAVAQMMSFVNEFTPAAQKPREAMEKFTVCLAPFAPHLAEELWSALGHDESITYAPFPDYDEAALVLSHIEIIVQINSKIRAKLNVAADADAASMEAAARAHEQIAAELSGKDIKKVIAVPGKLVNFLCG